MTNKTKYSVCSNLHQLSVEKRNKVALNPFDDKRLFINPIQSLPWDNHTQNGDCPWIFCLKLIGLYQKETSEYTIDEEIYLYIWYSKKI